VGVASQKLADARGKRVLVVGCNRGREVRLFLDAGAPEVWAIDVMDDVGLDFPDERARYLQMSAEAIDIDDSMFDIVFCVATMEHVGRPEVAFREITRVAARQALVYVVSAPLWHSREGHHKADIFDVDRYPWVHLRFDAETLNEMCTTGTVEYRGPTQDITGEIDYMMNSGDFDRRPARDYIGICSQLSEIAIERNDLDLEPASVLNLLPAAERVRLVDRVGDPVELRALTHTLSGWKVQGPRRATRARLGRRLRGLRPS